MSQPTIRRAVVADAAVLGRVSSRAFSETFAHLYPAGDLAGFLARYRGEAAFARILADPGVALWLAEMDGAAVGYAYAGPCDLPHPEVTTACGELKQIFLLRAAQGGGLGGRLLDAAFEWLERDGPRTLWIGVYSENHGAQRLYARHGFEKVGTYEFIVGETRDPEFILRRAARASA